MFNAITPLSGWMLDLTVELDAHHPGFAGAYLRSSPERRQVIAAYCSSSTFASIERADVAAFLLRSGHKAILREAYSMVPTGLRGALARSGGQPHDRRFYSTLHRLLSAPRHGRMVKTISQMPMIDFARLRILNLLSEMACTPSVIEALGDVNTAKDAVKVIELLVANGVDRHALGKAITSVSDRQQLTKLWDRWAARCRLPAPPVKAADGYRPVQTADDLRRLARRFRNCAARYLAEALDGFSAFGEFLPSEGSPAMVVHLRLRPDGWEIDGLFTKHNGRPAPEDRQRARDFLHAAGVRRAEQVKKPEGPWRSLHRLTSRMVWDLDDD